jgi:hypothetical protein
VTDDFVGRHVAGKKAQWVGPAIFRVAPGIVDHMTPIGRELDVANSLDTAGSWLSELPGDPTHSKHRKVPDHLHGSGQLVHQASFARDMYRRAITGILRAVSRLNDKSLAVGDAGQLSAQCVHVIAAY